MRTHVTRASTSCSRERRCSRFAFFQRGVISMEKGPADLFQPQASTRVTGPEASSCEGRFIKRKTEENTVESDRESASPRASLIGRD